MYFWRQLQAVRIFTSLIIHKRRINAPVTSHQLIFETVDYPVNTPIHQSPPHGEETREPRENKDKKDGVCGNARAR